MPGGPALAAPRSRGRRGVERQPIQPASLAQKLALVLCITNGATLALGWIAAGHPKTPAFTWALDVGLAAAAIAALTADRGNRLRRFGIWTGCAFAANASFALTSAGAALLRQGGDAGGELGHLALGLVSLGLAGLPLATQRIYPPDRVLSHELARQAGGLQRGGRPRRVILRLQDGRPVPAVVKAGYHLTGVPPGVKAADVVDLTPELPRSRWKA